MLEESESADELRTNEVAARRGRRSRPSGVPSFALGVVLSRLERVVAAPADAALKMRR
jgi:hypothetical protein